MNAAVFVDFENLYRTLGSRVGARDLRVRDTALGVLQGLVARLRADGHPMLIGRSYAAFDTYPGSEVAHDLALLGLDPQYVVVGHSGRDSADVQLTFDVARVLFRRPDIGMIAVVSGDRDFLPLAREVLEEGRELRLVSISDATSGDLRARVGAERFWDALALAREPVGGPEALAGDIVAASIGSPVDAVVADAVTAEVQTDDLGPIHAVDVFAAHEREARRASRAAVRERAVSANAAVVVGRIPVTWSNESSPAEHDDRLKQCVELMIRSRLRHGSKDVWLSPFLKGAMSQHFAHVVHPERRAMINELRDRGVLRIEERENLYADHPYSVIVLDDEHALVKAAWARVRQGAPLEPPLGEG